MLPTPPAYTDVNVTADTTIAPPPRTSLQAETDVIAGRLVNTALPLRGTGRPVSVVARPASGHPPLVFDG